MRYRDKEYLQSPSIGVPLEAAYHPTKLVSEVWKSREAGVAHLYRYTNLDRLVYPPGLMFRHLNNSRV